MFAYIEDQVSTEAVARAVANFGPLPKMIQKKLLERF